MKGKYYGPITVDNFFRALPQDRLFFLNHDITHIKGVYLYFTPCDAHGREFIVYDENGRPLDGYVSAGIYRSAADQYDHMLRESFQNPRPLLPVRLYRQPDS